MVLTTDDKYNFPSPHLRPFMQEDRKELKLETMTRAFCLSQRPKGGAEMD